MSESAFNDALVAVATANTSNYLVNRLRSHPLVDYLDDKYALNELTEKLLLELHDFDSSLERTTVILLLVQAILNKTGGKTLPQKISAALLKSKVLWAREILSMNRSKHSSLGHTVTTVDMTAPTQQRSSVFSSGASSSFVSEVIT